MATGDVTRCTGTFLSLNVAAQSHGAAGPSRLDCSNPLYFCPHNSPDALDKCDRGLESSAVDHCVGLSWASRTPAVPPGMDTPRARSIT